ncbi:hypothetical protein [Ferrimicrobium acidiphilum]|uniref:Uncharacterized protein n=1 Tax=Ferrimicrobium acidiphilum TaxID=121039 RepID=A0ABV3Y5R9_9ACTN
MESQTAELKRQLELEIVKLRRSGKLPPSLEAKMTQAVSELKPRLRFDSTRDRLFNLEATSYIDTAVPTDSQKPGVALVKRVIKAGIGWYLTYVTQQINNFTFETVGLLNALELRLAEQERRLARVAPHIALGEVIGHFPVSAHTEDLVYQELRARRYDRPLLIAEAASDGLLARLSQDEPDFAYGQEADPRLADDAAARGLDIRNTSLLWHLEHCGDGSLGGVVLRGVELECSPIWYKRAILAEIARVLAPSAIALLVHHEPEVLDEAPDLEAMAAIRGEPISAKAWGILADEAGYGTRTERIDALTAITRLER